MSLFTGLLLTCSRLYHQWMHLYNAALLRDCADPEARRKYARRALYHGERWIRNLPNR